MKLTRRQFTGMLGAMGVLFAARPVRAVSRNMLLFADMMQTIEASVRGRLGVYVHDTHDDRVRSYRADERFPMCSTFKVLIAGTVLAKVDQGQESLERIIHYTKEDLLSYAPESKKHVDTGMSVEALCEAAITLSDNTAANLILKTLGGPEGLTAYLRSIGDDVTRLDRWEPTLNESVPGDLRDTTTPKAMTETLERLTIGDALTVRSREQLTAWMVANTTGGERLRKVLPATWRVGDKTGTGERGSTNDIAVIWPAGRKPIVASVYLTETESSLDACNAAIAGVGQAIMAEFSHS